VGGYEVAVRVSVARLPAYKADNYATGIWGAPGSAAAASRLLDLSREGFHRALGIALAHGPFPPAGAFMRDSMVKEVIGWSGVVGCSAALLARDGFSGPVDALDQADRYDPAALVADLGARYAILQSYIKPYAACRWSHPAIDGVLQLAGDHDLAPDEVEEIYVEGFAPMARLSNPAPTTTVAAQYSVPFAVALALVHGRLGPAQLTDENLHDPELQCLARKVRLSVIPEFDRLFPAQTASRVTIRTGRAAFSATVEYPRGNPENPLSETEVAEKFHWLTAGVVGAERSRELQAVVSDLEKSDDVRRLAALLAF
jgi:2-methylcitrate dehydratase PrpD